MADVDIKTKEELKAIISGLTERLEKLEAIQDANTSAEETKSEESAEEAAEEEVTEDEDLDELAKLFDLED